MDTATCQITPLFKSGRLYGLSYFYVDSRGYIWIAAKYMLYRVNLANEADQKIYRCGKKGLGDYFITDMNITEDSHHQIYIAIFGSGLYRYDRATDSFRSYTTSNSNIISDYCYEVQGYQGKLLINTDRGFSIFDTGSKHFWNIEIASDFPLSGIHRGCGMTGTHDGEIFVGGTNGLASFDVRRAQRYDLHYQLYISRLFLGNHEVLPTDSTGILTKAICYTSRIDLAYDQNDITLYFTTNNYIGFYRHPLYEYMLEGYENRWTQTYERRINYTKITPGSYTLIIRERPFRGGQIRHEARIDIVVHPPFYKTTLAYLLYMAAFAGLLYYVYRFKRRQLLLTMSLKQEKKDKKNIIDLNQAKLQFFTNISHEFRTPLTLLIAKLDTFLDETTQGSALYRKFSGLKQNANHMLSLVNELLDFRKIEQGHFSLHVTENDIVPFAQSIYKSFEEFAHDRHINYVFCASEPSILCWYDPKQMEKVVLNLLSNAFKFTNADKGYVELRVGADDGHVVLQVLDNGIGIAKKDLSRIFERFYQVATDFKSIATMSGTGIGLALVKDIIEAHHGNIHVESSPSYGSVFTAQLPKGKSHFTSEELSAEPQIQSDPSNPSNPSNLSSPSSPSNQTTQNYTILIVEDNEEMRLILKDLFSKTYHVLLANDGKEGLDMVRSSGPDIVLSDVMMPVMSGTDLCKAIKDDLTICHIPVVLLTAMGSTEHELNGLRCGADDYIAKPFEPRLLLARCNNLINTRQMLRKSAMETKSDISLLATNPLDKTFLQTCNTFIEENIDNNDFSVDTLAQRMNMGRTTFFNKFKALTGVTPNDYVLSYRLHLSAILLKQNTDLQVADIAYQFGFNSPNYFSQCFKKKYGVTPTEFRVSGEDVGSSK
jgi:signal transduction histidine kinase/DNA-binding response OmpR family regulator